MSPPAGITGAACEHQVEPLWTVREVMAYLRRSERWVRGHADELGAIREFGGLRFDPEVLRARAAGKVLPFSAKR